MRVAVVGAGVSGLAAIKCCLDEGLDVVCFESRNDLGGVWNYTETVQSGQPTVARCGNVTLLVTLLDDLAVAYSNRYICRRLAVLSPLTEEDPQSFLWSSGIERATC